MTQKVSNGNGTGKEAETLMLNKEDSSKPEVTPIKNTPFAAVKTGENEYVIIFGKYMITNEKFRSIEECTEHLKEVKWNELLNVIGIYVEHLNNNK